MVRDKKSSKGRLDKFYRLAKEQGYRARSAFKLVQLNKKYNFLARTRVLIDLCAAPGGWLQVAAKSMPMSSLIIGVDLEPIKPVASNVITMVNDITTEKCRQDLRGHLHTRKADVVLHDGAPNMGQAWEQDAYTQADLVLKSLRLATEFLVENGVFVTKVFRSKDYNKLLFVFNQLFRRVEVTKPTSSRNVSAEIFVVCIGYLDPKNLDPKLLDSKYVFSEVDDGAKSLTVRDLMKPSRKRHRDGYEDGNVTLFKTTTAADFIEAENPANVLGTYNALTFEDDKSKSFLEGITGTLLTDIVESCKDLKILGPRDFARLLRWRTNIHRERERVAREAAAAEKAAQEPEGVVEITEENLDEELAKVEASVQAADKRRRKQLRLLRVKLQSRIRQLAMQSETGEAMDETLFSLRELSKKYSDLAAHFAEGGEGIVLKSSQHGEDLFLGSDAEEELEEDDDDGEVDASDIDGSDAEAAGPDSDTEEAHANYYGEHTDKDTYLAMIESNMHDDYISYLESRNKTALLRKMAKIEASKKRSRDPAQQEEDADSDEDPVHRATRHRHQATGDHDEGDMDAGASEALPPSQRASIWFSNPLFKNVLGDTVTSAQLDIADEDDSSEIADEIEAIQKMKREYTKAKGRAALAAGSGAGSRKVVGRIVDDDSDDESDHADSEEDAHSSGDEGAHDYDDDEDLSDMDSDDLADLEEGLGSDAEDEDGFEIDRQDDTSGDFSAMKKRALDPAQITLASRLRSKIHREAEIDASYNRYAFDDDSARGELPSWFADDEGRHNRPEMPITKEAVALHREQQRAVDARPIKKILEAQGRKKVRATRRAERIRQKAEAIINEGDLSEKAKHKQILGLYRAKIKKKEEVTYVPAIGSNKGIRTRPRGVTGRYKLVDTRMKKDMRARKARERRARK
ncbi:methyltransferase [Fonticula alba]|uniref:Putative rRNA methyltransferase n=1 Tax=Fonticula alba TaxID=691883 RepID=A0A058Z887_FONAL|nr:methyltransferase [Fonticula alba]KCV70133.1 methyltransferase [Fonticula alba]|eukprot:XP_009495739.1 methyltransferase [Fonticula alba]